jgi:hypothetical protein
MSVVVSVNTKPAQSAAGHGLTTGAAAAPAER